jgi:hypothetical protein
MEGLFYNVKYGYVSRSALFHAHISNMDLQLHRGHRARLPQCASHQRQLQQPDTMREHRR